MTKRRKRAGQATPVKQTLNGDSQVRSAEVISCYAGPSRPSGVSVWKKLRYFAALAFDMKSKRPPTNPAPRTGGVAGRAN